MNKASIAVLGAVLGLASACGDDGTGDETGASTGGDSGSTTQAPATDDGTTSGSSGEPGTSGGSTSTGTPDDSTGSTSEGETDTAGFDCDALAPGPLAVEEVFPPGAPFNGSEDIAFDGQGNVAGKSGGNVVLVAAGGSMVDGWPDPGPAWGMRFTAAGELLAAKYQIGEIHVVNDGGAVLVNGLAAVNGLFPDFDGNLWFTDGGAVRRRNADGSIDPIVTGNDGNSANARHAVAAGVSAYIVAGLSSERIRPILDVAMARFEQEQALRRQLADTRSALDARTAELQERKVIDRAKGMLMQRHQMGEQQAYERLRKSAMDKNLRLVEVAQRLLDAMELLD